MRTHTVGHLRDVRRLVVALSRARLGLYIFGRIDQFANCQELRPAFNRLLGRHGLGPDGEVRSTRLHLTPWEVWRDPRSPTSADLRPVWGKLSQEPVVIDDMPTMAMYVSKIYEERMKEMISRYNTLKGARKSIAPRPVLKEVEPIESAEEKQIVEIEKDTVIVKMDVGDSGGTSSDEDVPQQDPVGSEASESMIPSTLNFEVKNVEQGKASDIQ